MARAGQTGMKVKALLLLAAVVATSNVHAAGSVQINGYTFYCQNSCVVYQSPGGLSVGDSRGGWVRIYTPYGPIPY